MPRAQVATDPDAMAGRHEERRLPEPGLHVPVPRVEVLRAELRAPHQGTIRASPVFMTTFHTRDFGVDFVFARVSAGHAIANLEELTKRCMCASEKHGLTWG